MTAAQELFDFCLDIIKMFAVMVVATFMAFGIIVLELLLIVILLRSCP